MFGKIKRSVAAQPLAVFCVLIMLSLLPFAWDHTVTAFARSSGKWGLAALAATGIEGTIILLSVMIPRQRRAGAPTRPLALALTATILLSGYFQLYEGTAYAGADAANQLVWGLGFWQVLEIVGTTAAVPGATLLISHAMSSVLSTFGQERAVAAPANPQVRILDLTDLGMPEAAQDGEMVQLPAEVLRALLTRTGATTLQKNTFCAPATGHNQQLTEGSRPTPRSDAEGLRPAFPRLTSMQRVAYAWIVENPGSLWSDVRAAVELKPSTASDVRRRLLELGLIGERLDGTYWPVDH